MKKTKGKSSFIIKLILGFNILFTLALIIACLAKYISPEKLSIIPFFGISFPLIYLANVVFLIIWLIWRRKYALFLGILLLGGLLDIFKLVQSSKVYDAKTLKEVSKVISFNVRDFDIYNYGKNWAFNYTNRNKIFSFLTKEQPDILCLQEYVYDNSGKFKTTDTLIKILKAKNRHIVFTTSSRKKNYFGIATFTKYPVVDTGRIDFEMLSGNNCIYTDIKIKNEIVRVYNVHLESIHLQSEDYIFAERFAYGIRKPHGIKENSGRIYERMEKAFLARAPQARLVAEHIKKCPYPIILCGDFNDTPTSYAYHTIASKLSDAFVESGNGIGQTYAGVFPFLRIDYILHSKGIKSYNFETGEEEMSDHFPVKCYLKLEK